MGGLFIYQIQISNKSQKPNVKKKVIYLQARQHAAETHGSHIMQSVLRDLVTNHSSKYAKLLDNYVVRILPMINVDGVTIGNSRCSLAGVDLNRRWAQPNSIVHPEIYFLKQLMG